MRLPIVVLGSVNMDVVVRVPKLAAPGETVAGEDAELLLGGKGANQAVAAKRLGGVVHFCAAVGADAFADAALGRLAAEGLASTVQRRAHAATGVALIAVDGGGQNAIVLSPGANATLDRKAAIGIQAGLHGQILLLQNETPAEAGLAAAEAARSAGGLVIVDPAPATGFDRRLIAVADWITPNETETETLLGFAVDDREALVRAARQFRAEGARGVVIKLGGRGAFWSCAEGEGLVAAPPVTVVDTVGAGDCFNGAFAVALSERRAPQDAVDFACRAAALSVSRAGAADAMPLRREIA